MGGEKVTIIYLKDKQTNKIYKKSFYPELNGYIKNKVKVEVCLPNYATKFDLKGATASLHQNLLMRLI